MADAYLGEIRMFSGNYAPEGWAFCNGQALSISQNEALFSLLGTTYGGDGRSTFNLPDLRGRVPIHFGTYKGPEIQTPISYALGAAGGAETVTLTTATLPAHTHTAACQSDNGTQAVGLNAVWAAPAGRKQYLSGGPVGLPMLPCIEAAGGDMPHDNLMPFRVLSFIIAVEGLYPSPPDPP
jgi:microcystin-dependent protein